MSAQPRARVGLLGGTFDPPHVGHLIVAEQARVSLELDEVRFLVAGDPWMKAQSAGADQRVAMTELAVERHGSFSVDGRETRRPGETYTADTLEALTSEEPHCEWVFLLGADAARQIPDWRRAEAALAQARFVALTRPGYELALDHSMLSEVERLEVPAISISSTDLRARFGSDDAVRFQLPRAVERYIRANGLYGARRE